MEKTNDIILQQLAGMLKAERPNLLRYACYRLGNKDDAEDVLQETFLKLHTRLSDSEALQINNLRNYLFRTLSNVCTKWTSQASRLKTIPLNSGAELSEAPADTRSEDDFQRIARLLTKIPEEQAEVIRLRIYGDNSFAEVAEILSLPLPTVKSRFLYALEKLRKAIKQQ